MRSNGEGKPVVAVDIDGTLADYHGWFLKFAELYLGKPMPDPKKINPGEPLNKHMGITKPLYREVKLAYRQGGMKRSMPMLPGSAGLLKAIRAPYGRRLTLDHRTVETGDSSYQEPVSASGLGCEVWICTTRPYLRLDNIDPDTREWLRRNRIQYDALLFDSVGGDNKYKELMRQAGDRVVCTLEDLPEQAVRAFRARVPFVFLREQPYNQHFNRCSKFGTAKEGYDMVKAAVDAWHQRYPLAGY